MANNLTPVSANNVALFDSLISFLDRKVQSHNAKLLVFAYPPAYEPSRDSVIEGVCRKHNIPYIDLSGDRQLIDTTGYPTRGFMNIKMGVGHLNSFGSKVLADALYLRLMPVILKYNSLDTLNPADK